MSTTSKRPALVRGIAVIAGVMLAAGAISPALSAKKPITKKKATKLIKKLAIEEKELNRFGPFTANVGDTEKTIHTFGPFSISLLCEDDAGNVRVRVQIATTAANSTLNSDSDDEDVFGPDDLEEDLSDNTDGAPGGPQDSFDEDREFFVAGPGGSSLYYGHVTPVANFGGSHCWVGGYVLQLI